jgi:hypothetical protein
MEESGSEGLDDLIKSEVKKGKGGWFDGVDCVCIVSETNFCMGSSSSIDISFRTLSPIITGLTLVHLPLRMGSVGLPTTS